MPFFGAEVQVDAVCLTVDIAREILRRPADLQQHLFDAAALGRMHHDRIVVDPGTEHRLNFLVPQHFFQYGPIETDQHQTVRGMFHQLEPAVAGHGLDHIDQQRLRYRVTRIVDQRVDNLLGVVAGRAGIPQRQRCHPIGVHMFGCAFEFGERCDRLPRGIGLLVVHLQQQGFVALHDERSVRHGTSSRSRAGPRSTLLPEPPTNLHQPYASCADVRRERTTPRPVSYPPDSRGQSAAGPGGSVRSRDAIQESCRTPRCRPARRR